MPLCAAHKVVLAETGRPQAAKRSAVLGVFEDLLSGKKITRDRLGEALDEAVGYAMGGHIAQGYYPDIDASGRTQHQTDGRRVHVRWWEFLGGQRPPGQRAPHDAEHQHTLAARRRARVVLGFADSEPVTEAAVNDRRKAMARKNHPDLVTDEREKKIRTEKMMEINAAADILIAELASA